VKILEQGKAHAITLIVLAVTIGCGNLLARPDAVISYVGQFGERGNQGPAGTFYYPHDIDVDSEGRLIVVEWGNSRIQRCTKEGQCEIIVDQLADQPAGLAIDEQDRMLLTSWPDAHHITLCHPTGECSVAFGSLGQEVGEFNDPAGPDIDSRGRLVIADAENNRVQFCSFDGECSAFGTFNSGPGAAPGEFWKPRQTLADGTGRIFVGESGDEVISVCDESGTCVARMGSEGTGVGEFKTPSSLALSSRGDLVVFETSNNRMQLCDISDYDISDDCIAFGGSGEGDGQFRSPHGVHVDAEDRVFIADQDNHRIQVLQITYNDGFQINPGLNDAWYNPATNGQGMFIVVLPELRQLFLAWFTYDTERPPNDVAPLLGDAGHRWLTAQGAYNGNTANLTIYVTSGGVFDDIEPAPTTDAAGDGSITLEFADCREGLLSYEITSLGLSGEIPIERVAGDNATLCEEIAAQ